MLLFNSKKFSEKNKNIIIFSFVAVFAIQTLFFTEVYTINTPFADDYDAAVLAHSIIENKKISYDELIFNQYIDHRPIFPRLVVIASLLFDSFHVKNALYFGFMLMLISIFLLYKLLKKIDRSLTWLLIPISAFFFSPLQHLLFVSPFAGLQWQFPLLGTIAAVYFMSKDKLNNKSIVVAFFFSIIATFSDIIGLIIFIIIIMSFYYVDKERIKYLLIWITLSSSVFFLYFKNLVISDNSLNFSYLFTIEGLSFILRFISVPFRLKYDYLVIPVGIISLLMFFGFSLYLILIKKKQISSLPWLQIGLMSFFSAVVTELGRIGSISIPQRGDATHYTMISNLSHIAILVFASIILLDVIKNHKSNKYKQICSILFVIFVITQMVMLIPSYYLGWKLGNDYYDYEIKQHFCFIPSNYNPEFCKHLPSWPPSKIVELYNYLLEQKFAMFSNFDLSKYNKEIFADLPIMQNANSKNAIGHIEKVNGMNVSKLKSIEINESVVMISGWILDPNKQKMDTVILLVDDEPFIKHDYFIPREDVFNEINHNTDSYAGWEIGFLAGFIEKDCYTIHIVGIKNNEVFRLDQEIELCKNF